MKNNAQKQCQICKKKFNTKDLYPIALIRNSVLNLALKNYPEIDLEGFVCIPDLRKVGTSYFEDILKQEKGAISELEKEVLESLKKHELLSENINIEFEENLTFGERLADRIARFGGSWTFIMLFAFVLFFWMGVNTIELFKQSFDPYPYIFLNLILSCLAAIQAPIIMMSQNRQASKDHLAQENDYQTNLKSELQIRQVNTKLELFMKLQWQKMHEITRILEELLRDNESKK